MGIAYFPMGRRVVVWTNIPRTGENNIALTTFRQLLGTSQEALEIRLAFERLPECRGHSVATMLRLLGLDNEILESRANSFFCLKQTAAR